MKKHFYILTLIFAFPLVGLAQNDAINIGKEQATYKNQWDLDVELLGIVGNYKHRIDENFYVGMGLGIGAISSVSGDGMFFELYRFSMFIGYQYTNKIHFYVGPKYAPSSISIEQDDNVNILGLESGVFYKASKIEFGIKISFIYSKEPDGSEINKSLTSSLLVLRIPLSKW